MAVLETATLTYSFWPKTAQKYREAVHTEGTRNEGTRAALFVKPHARVVWLCAFFLLGYVGTEVALGGWVVQFMLRVRNADPFDAGMTAVGFWLGITIGRLVLGMVIPKIGVKLSLMIFIPVIGTILYTKSYPNITTVATLCPGMNLIYVIALSLSAIIAFLWLFTCMFLWKATDLYRILLSFFYLSPAERPFQIFRINPQHLF